MSKDFNATFTTSLEWTEKRSCISSSPKKVDIDVACPPPFCTCDDKWSPEDFFVSSIETCFVFTFLYLAENVGMEILSYKSRAVGTINNVDRKLRFTKIDLYPEVVVAKDNDPAKIERLLRGAERSCPVTLSSTAEVIIHPTITTR